MDMLGFSFLAFIVNLFTKISYTYNVHSNITSVSSSPPPAEPLPTFMTLLFLFF